MQSNEIFITTLQKWVDIFMRRSMRNFIVYAKTNGFSMTQIGALFHIHRTRGCGVSDVGDDLGITSAAASQLLERLVQQGLVMRSEDPNDRRLKLIEMTEKGRMVVEEGIHARQSWFDELAMRLTPEEQRQVTTALDILIEKTQQLE